MSEPDRYDAIPKVELHCHLEGTVRPSTVVELARKHGRTLPTEDPTELYRYTSLDSFLEIFWLVQSLIGDREDWARVGYEATVDAAGHGLRYREAFFTPARHLEAGQSLAEIVAGLTEGLEGAERETGVRTALICDIDRSYGPIAAVELAEDLVDLRRTGRADRVIGLGMDSTERGVDPADFAPAYQVARHAGLRVTGHAGEDTGPENIAAAHAALGLERIDHGIAIVEDAELMRRMADARIPFNVCPSSNVVIANRYASVAEHPLRDMREAGLLVTINTDDPAMTDADLGAEYRAVAEQLGFSFEEMCAIAVEGVEATWLDDGDKATLRHAFHEAIERLATAS
ncbi:MAG TPA: adenosine deaminase [Candidatus Limnocylindrales bacterium]|jgi:adenosine deaminase|nr:adenosine deaminase [Candidatus Limnocylindrales bacterium]